MLTPNRFGNVGTLPCPRCRCEIRIFGAITIAPYGLVLAVSKREADVVYRAAAKRVK